MGPRPSHRAPGRHDLRLLRRRRPAVVRRLPPPRDAPGRGRRRVAVTDRPRGGHRCGRHDGDGRAAHGRARVHGCPTGRPQRPVARAHARRPEHDLLLGHLDNDGGLLRRARLGHDPRRTGHALARLGRPGRRRLQRHRGLDRRHLQQLPRQGLAGHRLGRLHRLPRRHADPQRLSPPPPRRPSAQPQPAATRGIRELQGTVLRHGNCRPGTESGPFRRPHVDPPDPPPLAGLRGRHPLRGAGREHRTPSARDLRARRSHAPRHR